jgi:hypothetical protein
LDTPVARADAFEVLRHGCQQLLLCLSGSPEVASDAPHEHRAKGER